jgi:hypothetical protein
MQVKLGGKASESKTVLFTWEYLPSPTMPMFQKCTLHAHYLKHLKHTLPSLIICDQMKKFINMSTCYFQLCFIYITFNMSSKPI